MIRIYAWLIAALILLPSSLHAEPVKVGAILSLTGDVAYFGSAIQRGMELAVREGEDIQVIYEDDQTLNRTQAVAATKKLIAQDKVPLILNMVVNTITAIAPILTASNTIGLVVWDSNKTIASVGENIFGMGYSTELAGADLADFIKVKLGSKSVAVISAHDEWSELISESFVSQAKKIDLAVTFHERVNVDNKDFRSLMVKARSQKVDAVFAPLFGAGLLSWVRQSRELRFNGHLLTGDSISPDEVKQLGDKLAEGLYAAQVWVDNPEFIKKVSGEDGVKLGFIAMGYDSISCVRQLFRALSAEGKPFEANTIQQKLKSFVCQGVTGSIKIAQASERRQRILQVRSGQFVPQ